MTEDTRQGSDEAESTARSPRQGSDEALERVRVAGQARKDAEDALEAARVRLGVAIKAATRRKVSKTAVAEAAGVSRQTVYAEYLSKKEGA